MKTLIKIQGLACCALVLPACVDERPSHVVSKIVSMTHYFDSEVETKVKLKYQDRPPIGGREILGVETETTAGDTTDYSTAKTTYAEGRIVELVETMEVEDGKDIEAVVEFEYTSDGKLERRTRTVDHEEGSVSIHTNYQATYGYKGDLLSKLNIRDKSQTGETRREIEFKYDDQGFLISKKVRSIKGDDEEYDVTYSWSDGQLQRISEDWKNEQITDNNYECEYDNGKIKELVAEDLRYKVTYDDKERIETVKLTNLEEGKNLFVTEYSYKKGEVQGLVFVPPLPGLYGMDGSSWPAPEPLAW